MNVLRRIKEFKYSRWTSLSWMAAVVTLHILCFARTTTTAFVSPRISRQSAAVGISSRTSLADSANTNHESTIKIRAAVYQPPIRKMETAADKENPLKVLTEVADVLQLASKCAIDVVQFPELFLNGGLLLDEESAPLDRESYALNIVGNLCEELQVACSIGYAESGEDKDDVYSSLAIFHADGSRAGNYRCINPSNMFEKGHPLVEAMPITLLLPERIETPTLQESITLEETKATTTTREIKVGVICGGDLSVPEHTRYLARNGANLLCVSGSLKDSKMARRVLFSRSIENNLPLLFSNYVSEGFIGQSAVLTKGTELVRAPETLDGDMPSDEGYFLPCETGGALYAADLNVNIDNNSIGDSSIEQWDITPKIHQLGDTTEDGNITRKDEKPKGFGREVLNVLEQSKKKNLRLKNTKK